SEPDRIMARGKLEQSRHLPAVSPDHTRVIEPCCRPFSFCGQVFADRVKKIGVPGVNPIFPRSGSRSARVGNRKTQEEGLPFPSWWCASATFGFSLVCYVLSHSISFNWSCHAADWA